MSGRGKKSNGATSVVTPKRRTREATKRPHSPLVGSTTHPEPLNDLDMSEQVGTEKDILAGVKDLLIDISSRFDAHEKGMKELKASREQAPGKSQSVSATW